MAYRAVRMIAVALAFVVLGLSGARCGDARRPVGNRSGGVMLAGKHGLIRPGAMVLTPSYLVVADDDHDGAIKVLDRQTGTLLGQTGRQGDGPGEFRYVASLAARQDADGTLRIQAFDRSLRRITHLGWDLTNGASAIRVVGLSGGAGNVVMALGEGMPGVGAGGLSDHRFQVFDSAGSFVAARGKLPTLGDRLPIKVVHQALQPALAVDASGETVAIGARYVSRLDLYDRSSGALLATFSPDGVSPELKVGHNGAMAVLLQDDATRFGFIALTGGEDRLYALYSGRVRGEAGPAVNSADRVFILDWSGRVEDSLRLPGDAHRISVDERTGELFYLRADPDIVIGRVSLDR